MATTPDIVIEIDGRPTMNSVGGWVDTILDLNFGSPAYIYVFATGHNDALSLTLPPAPKAAVTAPRPGKLIYSQTNSSSSSSLGTVWYVWYHTQTVLFRPGPPPVFGPYGYDTLADDIANNLPPGNFPSPTYGDMLGGQFFATQADAQAYSAFLDSSFGAFAVSQVGSIDHPRSSSSFTGEWLFKVAASAKSNLALIASGVSSAPGSGFGANVSMFTTGNPAGTINITGKQVAKIKSPPDFAPLGISQDKISSASGVSNKTYKFTCWRDHVKPPHALWEGVHIKGSPPFPTV